MGTTGGKLSGALMLADLSRDAKGAASRLLDIVRPCPQLTVMKQKPLKTELHHWWPRTLAGHWAAGDGMVSVIRPNGSVRRAPPGTFGAITNAHHMKMGGPWDSTFEPIFNEPDNELAGFVQWLATLEASLAAHDRPKVERILPQPFPDERAPQIARVTASLRHCLPAARAFARRSSAQPNISGETSA